MATPINPGDVYKYITVAYKDKEFARSIYPDALAFDGFVKKWFIKPQFKEHEALFKAYNPQYPSAIRVPESHKPFSISRQEVTPLKVKVGPLSTFVLNNLHVKNLVLNIKETYSTEEKLFLSSDQIRDDLQYEMDSVFYELKETIVENAMNHHFNAFIDHSCVKNLLDYFVGVASSTQTEALALMGPGNEDDDDEEVKELKKQLLRRKVAKRIRADVIENSGRTKRRREDVDEKIVDENTRLALQIENDNLLAMMAQMREEMRSLIKVGGNEVQATPSSSLVDLASSPQAFSSSSSSESSLTTTTPLVTTQQTSGVTAQEIQPTLVKTINVKVEKKSGNNNLFVILT